MSIVERLGWWLVARSSGYRGRCGKGHVYPDSQDYYPCSFCKEWCEGCGDWVDRATGLDDVHWPHPKPPTPMSLSSKVEKLYADGDKHDAGDEAS